MTTKMLYKTLSRTSRLSRFAETARAAGRALAVLLTAVLAALALDAVLALDTRWLVALDAVLLSLVAAGAVYVAHAAWRNRFDDRRMGRFIEERLGIEDSRLINAIDLAAGRGGSGSEALTALAVARGNDLAQTIVPGRVIDWRRLARAWVTGGVALVVVLAGYLLLPGLYTSVASRLLSPFGDLPPYTLVKFSVHVEPEKVYFGHPARILADLGGPTVPDQADLVFIDGDARQRLPMVRTDRGQFMLQIERPEASREFYIDTSAGRSPRQWLTVLPVPQVTKVLVRYGYPAYTRWKTSEEGLTNDGVKALSGTHVTLTVQATLPLSRGELVLMPIGTAVPAAGGHDGCADGSCPLPTNEPGAAATGQVHGQDAHAIAATATAPAVRRTVMAATADGKAVKVSFPLSFSGRFEVHIFGVDGTEGDAPLVGTLTAMADQMPQVQITEPAAEIIAPEDWKVHVNIVATDDVGISRVTISPAVNGLSPVRLPLGMSCAVPTYATAPYEFDLKALGAHAGDVITYFATAWDNCPDAAHFADTAVYVIRVVSKEDYIAFARTQYRLEQVLNELDLFREKLAEIDKLREDLQAQYKELQDKVAGQGGKFTDDDLKKLRDLNEKYAQYEAKERALSAEMMQRANQQQIYDFEKSFAEMLNQMGDDLADRSNQAKEARENAQRASESNQMNSLGQRALGLIVDQLAKDEGPQDKAKEQLGAAEQDLKLLAKADRLNATVERIDAIAKQQRDLADRLGQFRNKEQLDPTEQIRARRLAEEQAQLEKDMQETLTEMDRAVKDAQKDLPKMSKSVGEMAQSVRDLEVPKDQADASKLAQAGQGRYAWQSADSAASKLESLYKECCKNIGEAGQSDLDHALALKKQQLASSLGQLSQGRGLPGMRQGPGGDGGKGYYGTRSAVALAGPHGQSSGEGNREGPHGPQNTASQPSPRSPGNPGHASSEDLNPDRTGQRGAPGGSMPGVPTKYRGVTEDYFRRLADDAK